MKPSEAMASLRVLLCVARCDGRLTADEHRVIEVAAHRAYAPSAPPLDWTAQEADLLRALADLRSPEARKLTMKAAVAVAAVDGKVSRKEHTLLEQIYAALSDESGAEDARPLDLSSAEQKYGGRMDEARHEIEHATVDFLHHVSDAQHGGKLSQAAYESLVNKLEAEKRSRIGVVMSMVPPPPRA